MTDKEQGALNTLIFEKQNQIEELELSITENKMKIKTYRDNIRQLESDSSKIKSILQEDAEKHKISKPTVDCLMEHYDAVVKEYEEQKEKERLHLLKANAVEVL